MDAIVTRGLTRRFGTKTAVDGLDLTVKEGELLALLGVNGAGKTTTVKMLSTLLAPTSGDAVLLGSSIVTDAVFGFGVLDLNLFGEALDEAKFTDGCYFCTVCFLHN